MVVVTREPEWDDHSRGRAMRLAEYEESICGCGCGLPVAVSRDKTRAFVVDDFTCYAGRALEQVREQKRQQAEALNLPQKHGQHFYVRAHDPDRDGELKPPGEPDSRRTRGGQVSPGPAQG